MTPWQLTIKNAIDRVVAAAALFLTLPLWLLAIAVIKINSCGPTFFTQVRIGLRGEEFTIYKFRTMHTGADCEPSGSVTVQHDNRLFPGAGLLRKFKVDELPQLLNVLNGTMSLVGPRPTVAEDHDRMTARQRMRTNVKPGLTGMAQIRGGAALPWPERIEYDLDYVFQYSVRRDFVILVNTAWLVTSGRADTNPIGADEWGVSASEQTDGESNIPTTRKRAA